MTIRKGKIKIEVFVPLGSCVCHFAPIMEKIAHVTAKFGDVVEVQTKSTKSIEASKYEVKDMCVIIDERIKLSASFDEKELEDAILRVRPKER